jgi:ubiquinone/menaquinone biosynthesis C-methylase UbiE
MKVSFDERARTWDDAPKIERARKIAAAIRAAVPLSRDMTAFEHGCGTGLLSFELRGELGDITLADTSEGMLEVLREKIAAAAATRMHPVKLDPAVDPLPAVRYGVVYSMMALHHVPDTDAVLRRFGEMLAPGGWLAIADLDREDGSFHGPQVDVHHGFERADLQRRAEAAGFRELRFSTVFEVRKGEPERAYPVFLMSARKA